MLDDLGIPEVALEHMSLTPQFDARDAQRALRGSGIEVPALESYAWRLWDHWERHLDPDLYKDRSFGAAVNGKTVLITGASSGIGRATALKVAAAGGIPLLVARTQEKLDEVRAEIERSGGTAYAYSADLSDYDSIDALVQSVFGDHPAVDMLVNNAGRSIRRSVALSYDRFHDYERTVRLNYLGTIRLVLGLLPHMRERRSGHIVNVSSIGVQANPPRFSAYVASKAALDAFTRVVSSETIGDNVTFTTIHMPLVRTPMIAPTKMYDSVPDDLPGRGRRPHLRGSARAAEADQHAARDVRARSPTRSRPRRSTGSCTWPTRCSRSPRPPAASRRPASSSRRARRWRSPTSCEGCTGDGQRVDRRPAQAQLEVQVRARRMAGGADAADTVARHDALTPADAPPC